MHKAELSGVPRYMIIILAVIADLLMLAALVFITLPEISLENLMISEGLCSAAATALSAGFVGGLFFDMLSKR